MGAGFALDTPDATQLRRAREAFERGEPRDLFYRLATWLMERALENKPPFSQTEAVAVLLQSWNRGYYQRQRKPFDAAHFSAIEGLLQRNEVTLRTFRARTIESATLADEAPIVRLFTEFNDVLGPTGATKALHMLAPRFFPLWDAGIAQRAYHLYRRDGHDYWRLVQYTREQVQAAGGETAIGRNPVKAIDEYNYCRYTLGQSF